MSNHALEKLYEKKLLFVRDARCFFALEGSFAKLNGVNTTQFVILRNLYATLFRVFTCIIP